MKRFPLSKRGFTLLEVLIALLLSSLIILTAVMALKGYMDFEHRSQKLIRVESRKTLFLYLFFKQLQNIPRLDMTQGFLFEGERSFLRFISYVPMTGKYFPGIFGVTYLIKDGSLFEKDEPLMDREDVLSFFKEKDEVEGAVRIFSPPSKISGFSFYDGHQWRDSWKELSSVPVVIKIELGDGSEMMIPVDVANRILGE